MSDSATIDIDFEVHKLIEAERTGFDDPPIAALRRLLNLPAVAKPTSTPPGSGRHWYGKGVFLPHGTLLRMTYNGREYEGLIDNGSWNIGGKVFSSPSAAASGTAPTKTGSTTSLNGWNYWYAKLPGTEKWSSLNSLWKRAKEQRSAIARERQQIQGEISPS